MKYQEQFVTDLYSNIVQMLNGSHSNCKRIPLLLNPSKFFIIGTLADSSKNWQLGDELGISEIQTKTAVKHNSMSVSFLISKDENQEINIIPTCSLFYKVYPKFEEQKEYLKEINENPELEAKKDNPGYCEIYKRLDCEFPQVTTLVNNANDFDLDFTSYINEIVTDPEVYFSKKFEIDWMESEETYLEKIKELVENAPTLPYYWSAKLELEVEEFDLNSNLVTIRFINTTPESKRYETFLFNCNFKINLNAISVMPFKYEYEYEDFNYLKINYLRCLNCQAEIREGTIETLHYGIYFQKRMNPRIEYNGINATFDELSSDTAINLLTQLMNEMIGLYQIYETAPEFTDTNSEFYFNAQKFRDIISRFQDGIELLKQNNEVLTAFQLMQETFSRASKYSGWRLFQIVFIVSLIPDIVDLNKNRDQAEVLHVDTGGGKSEAYFGLIIFLIFWDRLRGKSYGVSGLTKFPLRMLSIQQLQRIAIIFIWAEKIRKERDIPGQPFSVGYLVGVSEEFPRFSHEVIAKIANATKKGEKILGVLVDKCPFCSGNVILTFDKNIRKILHTCENCEEIFHLYFTNEEIYRFLPSFIISTVDKLAGVASNRRFKNLFGGKLSECPEGHGFIPCRDKCEVHFTQTNICSKIGQDIIQPPEGPTLIIQDEMHLLREGFGTIDSHFESLLNNLLKSFSNKEFKYIAMTATISGVKDQIYHLYNKEVNVFPGKSPFGKGIHDFFFEYEKSEDDKEKLARILIGLKPNLRDNQYASLLTIYHLTNYLKDIWNNIPYFATLYDITEDEMTELLRYYQCILTYHNKKADVHGMNYFLHTVVTSKVKNFEVIPKPLTGDNTLEEIKTAIQEIENFPDSKLHATFATSVVSHGVDIDRWNLMIFQGMTRNTSEYIQALSRAGRKLIGINFLWFYPNRIRDLSYYQNFQIFHEILEHKVERTPLSRWAKLGFKQTFTSIFCASILNYISNLIERPLYNVQDVNDFFKIPKNRKILIDFIKEAYYSSSSHPGALWFDSQIADEVEKRLNHLITYSGAEKNFFPNALADCDDYYFKTQYGMRGIQPQVQLRLSYKYHSLINKLQKGEEF